MFVAGEVYLEKGKEEPFEWLIEGMLPLSYLAVFAATSKCGKSCFITNMVYNITKGLPFLGKHTLESPVLWVACEESQAERAMVLTLYPEVSNNLYVTHERVSLETADTIADLQWWVRKTGAKLIVIDPLYGAVDMPSISKGMEGRSSLKELKELCRVENVAAVVLHHINKNVSVGMTRERFADSAQILAVASMDWLMESQSRDDGTRDLKLSTTGRGVFANRKYLIHSPSITEYELVAEGTGEDVFDTPRIDRIVTHLRTVEDGQIVDEIAEALKANPKTISNRIAQLVKSNQIEVVGKRGKASVYAVPGALVDEAHLPVE